MSQLRVSSSCAERTAHWTRRRVAYPLERATSEMEDLSRFSLAPVDLPSARMPAYVTSGWDGSAHVTHAIGGPMTKSSGAGTAFRYSFALALAVSLSGCGVMFGGTTKDISVVSTPSEARLTTEPLTGSFTTPATLTLNRKTAYTLVVWKEGYREAQVPIEKHIARRPVGPRHSAWSGRSGRGCGDRRVVGSPANGASMTLSTGLRSSK